MVPVPGCQLRGSAHPGVSYTLDSTPCSTFNLLQPPTFLRVVYWQLNAAVMHASRLASRDTHRPLRSPPLCRASAVLRSETAVDAVELFDRASLRECEADDEMTRLVPDIKGADNMAAALLIECRGQDPAALEARISEVRLELGGAEVLRCCAAYRSEVL
jgi:hypothetical protein